MKTDAQLNAEWVQEFGEHTECPECGTNCYDVWMGHNIASAEELAQSFHDTYERLAPQFGYETRKESAKPMEDHRTMTDNLAYSGLKKLYLAGPINGCSDSEANDWRTEVKEKLSDLYEFVDPMVRDYRGRELEPGIAHTIKGEDLKDIKHSDIILAMCPKPSVGTSMELVWAFDIFQKPVVVVAPSPASPWLIATSTVLYANLMAAITYLRQKTIRGNGMHISRQGPLAGKI